MRLESLEVYLHIPFCARKCAYCDFASCAGREDQMEEYCRCVEKEIRLRAAQYGPQTLATAYVGGGTPSLMPPELMDRLLDSLFEAFPPAAGAEITCEANPGTLKPEFLNVLRRHGVNRLSLGAQARQGRLLETLGRIHRWDKVEESVRMAREAGFDNISLDLMFGLPGQAVKDWEETVEAALALLPWHLSLYGLILEEGTPLFDREAAGELSLPGEEEERAMYARGLQMTRAAGLAQYEISNFALPGRECRHNLGYWEGVSYLGLGAAAHSRMPCDAKKGAYARFGNTPSLDVYLVKMGAGILPVAEYKEISFREAEFETLMLGLRLVKGVGEADFLNRHGRTMGEAFGERIKPLEKKGLLTLTDGFLRLTPHGMEVQNAVLVELMDEV